MCGPQRNHLLGCAGASIPQHSDKNSPEVQNTGSPVCLECGTTFVTEVNYCRKCGYKFKQCPISKEGFNTGDEFAQCKNCHSVYHYHHLRDWLKSNRSCPMCRKELTEILRGTAGRNHIVASVD